jgi:hypothetical protein
MAVWNWDGQSESKCPMCGELLVARRCKDRVWHWAHKPYTNQKQGTCLFDDSPWALRWRLGYLMFEGWKIEVPKKDTLNPAKVHLIHAINPETKQVREFVTHINEEGIGRVQFLLDAKTHNVCWMFNGMEQARALATRVGDKGGIKDLLKPKAQALYERICAAGQNALVHIEGKDGGTLYKEWVKFNDKETGKPLDKPLHTGIWFPIFGERALAVLDNYSKVVLPYDNAKSESDKADSTRAKAAAKFKGLVDAV